MINTTTGSRTSTIPVEPTASGIAPSPDGAVLYTVGWESPNVTALDVDSGDELFRMTNVTSPWVVRSASVPQ